MSTIYNAVITEEDDIYVAMNPETGVASQGSTVDESIRNLREALGLYLEELGNSAGNLEKRSYLTTFSL